MANEWYYAKGGRQQGPVAARDLKKLADQGALSPEDLVWKEGLPDWTPAGQVKGLFAQHAAGPAAQPPMQPQQAAQSGPNITPVDEPATYGRAKPRRRSRGVGGQVFLLCAAALMIAATFVPWWSMTSTNSDDSNGTENDAARQREEAMVRQLLNSSDSTLDRAIEQMEQAKIPENATEKERRSIQFAMKFLRIAKNDRKWWKKNLKTGDKSFVDRFIEVARKQGNEKGAKATIRIWGWNDGIGIMGMVFGIVVLVLSVVFLCVPILRNWSWTISIVATIMGILVLIFSLIWIFTAPGKDVGSEFRQGIIAGPYMLLAAGALFLVVGIFDTIFGLSYLSRARRLRQ